MWRVLCTYNYELPYLTRVAESSAALATLTCICVAFVAVWGVSRQICGDGDKLDAIL